MEPHVLTGLILTRVAVSMDLQVYTLLVCSYWSSTPFHLLRSYDLISWLSVTASQYVCAVLSFVPIQSIGT